MIPATRSTHYFVEAKGSWANSLLDANMALGLTSAFESHCAPALIAILVALAILLVPSSGGVGISGQARSVVSGFSSSPVTTINVTVGKSPGPMVYDPSNGYVYVWNTGSHNISVISGVTNTVITSIRVKGVASSLIYCPSNEEVYAASSYNLSIINGTSNTVVKIVKGPSAGFGSAAYDPTNGAVYYTPLGVTQYPSNLSKINKATNKLTLIPVGSSAAGVIYDPATRSIVVSNFDTNSLSVVNSSTNAVTNVVLPVGQAPYFMTYDPGNKDVYLPDWGRTSDATGNVSVLGPSNTIVATLTVGPCPWTATYDPADRAMYVLMRSGIGHCGAFTTVSVISSTNTIVASLVVGKNPSPVATYDPKNQEVFVPCRMSNATYFIDGTTNTLLKSTVKSPEPFVAFYDPGNHDMLVFGPRLSSFTLCVAVISPSNSRLALLTLGKGWGGGLAYDPANDDVYITLGHSVAVIE
jgi:YVTN family beta-propeller protein